MKIVVGRNEKENDAIVSLVGDRHPLFFPVDFNGPACAAMGRIDAGAKTMIARILYQFGRGDGARQVVMEHRGRTEELRVSEGMASTDLDRYRILT